MALSKIAVVTLFPEMFETVASLGVTGRALQQGQPELRLFNPRAHTQDRHQTVDDRPYGGGPGMLMKIQPLRDAIHEAKAWVGSGDCKVIYLSPQGSRFDQGAARNMAAGDNMVLVAGRYEGIDERLITLEIDEEWSIGDYVLSGGELGAMVMIDAIVRLLPGVLGHEQSAVQDSFTAGLLDCPHYTRPESYEGMKVPDVLLSGDHARIERWRQQQSLGRTWQRRPDLLKAAELSAEQVKLLEEYQQQVKD